MRSNNWNILFALNLRGVTWVWCFHTRILYNLNSNFCCEFFIILCKKKYQYLYILQRSIKVLFASRFEEKKLNNSRTSRLEKNIQFNYVLNGCDDLHERMKSYCSIFTLMYLFNRHKWVCVTDRKRHNL